ncbi:MAG: hypothetical protein M3179_10925, partial [Actinomycetota bacterium]|nr:hypothetical protein [Actinomycetota bacterium]
MGKFVTRGNIDKMTREEAEAAANQELQQKIGARGQATAADEPVESQLAVPAWARQSGGEGLLARLAR